MTDANATVEAVAQRRRWRWPRGLFLSLLAWVLLLGGVRLWWGQYAEGRLAAALAASRDAGLLLEIDGLELAGIRDAENGAYWLTAASRLLTGVSFLVLRSDAVGYCDFVDLDAPSATARLGLAPGDLQRDYIRKYVGVYAHLRAARGCAAREWPIPLTSPLANTMLPQVGWLFELARFAAVGAAASFAAGDHAAALEQIRDGLALAGHTRDPRLFLLGWLAAHAMDCIVLGAIEVAVGDILLCGEADAVGRGPATRAQVEALIAELLDESSLDAAWREMLRIEALEMRDSLDTIARGAAPLMVAGLSFIPPPMNALFAPGLKLRAARLQGPYDALAVARQDRPLAANALDDQTEHDSSLAGVLTGAGALGFRNWTQAVLVDYRTRCRRRMAACALAIRLYELDMGTRPARLSELVPDYLYAVPTDLLDPRRGPLSYLPDAKPPRLYSVGSDGLDDRGSSQPRPGERRPRDEVFVLNRCIDLLRAPRLPGDAAARLAAILPPADLTPARAIELLHDASNRDVDVQPPGGKSEE